MLKTPHFKQSKDGMCLPACTRMVLAHWGQMMPEADLAKLLGTQPFGTPVSNIKRLVQLGYQVDFGPLTRAQLHEAIDREQPAIVQVWIRMLSYWAEAIDGSHMVVVVGCDESHVYLNDPAFAEAPQRLVWDGFLAAWAEFDETAALIYPRV